MKRLIIVALALSCALNSLAYADPKIQAERKLDAFYSSLMKDGSLQEFRELRDAINSNLQAIHEASYVHALIAKAQKNKGLVLFEAMDESSEPNGFWGESYIDGKKMFFVNSSTEAFLDLLSSRGVNVAKQIRNDENLLTGVVLERGAKLSRNDDTLLSYRPAFLRLLRKKTAEFFRSKGFRLKEILGFPEATKVEFCVAKQCSEMELK